MVVLPNPLLITRKIFPLLVLVFPRICVLQSTGCDTRPADVIFLLDSSFSIGTLNFDKEKQFIQDFTTSVHIGPSKVQVGIIEYSSLPKYVIELDRYSDEYTLRNAISNIKHMGGGSNTGDALKYAYYNGFTPRSGDRVNVPDFIVVITDGFSDNFQATVQEARRLRNDGKTIYAIGVGNRINSTELAMIARDSYHMSLVPDFNMLHTIQTELHVISCTSGQTLLPITSQRPDACASSPCVNGRCYSDPTSFICICQSGYSGQNCDQDVCSSSPCRNGGRCFKNGADFICQCASGYSGTLCQNHITTPWTAVTRAGHCSSNPCSGQGRCLHDSRGYVCVCNDGTSGQSCPGKSTTTWLPITRPIFGR